MEPVDLKSRIEIALGRDHLSQWQRQFLVDIQARLVKYGPKARLSEKQRAKLFEALGYVPPNSLAPPPPRPNRSQSPLGSSTADGAQLSARLGIWPADLPGRSDLHWPWSSGP